MIEIKQKEKPVLTEKETGAILYSFVTPECVDHTRGKTWFIGMGIAVILGALFGVFQNSISLIILSFLLGAIYTISHNKKSPNITVSFTETVLLWGESFFLYSSLNSFWIIWKPGETQKLHINKSKGFPKEITIPIAQENPAKIKEILGYYVPEIEGKEEKFSDLISRVFKL